MDTTPTLANAVMAIQGTNSFPDYEQRLIDAFLTAEEKFKILDDHGENEAIPSSLDAEPGPFVAEDEVTPGSIELEVKEGPWLAKVGLASCSFKEQAEDTDAHVGRNDLVVQKDALTSSSSAVTQLGQAQASVNSETPHPSQANNHKAPLIIVRSLRDYQKRGIEEHEVVEAAKRIRVNEPPIPALSSAAASTCGVILQPIYTMNTFPSRQVREQERIYQRFRTVASLDPTISTAGEASIDHWAMEQLLALSGGIIRRTPKVREY
ncbi:hypothetical protein P167DRAFT_545594 [Morchella conica CCBAS932]|uniref:Uncharacterized protein n=1 Tax=Morchella conica CCBAS932 TaxID=1392247 RepID=A0A3N4L2Z1_9PEZI|nr:hypothetical protein P167DRAFT_545594 [Morchella conica CCBAS932]